MAIDPNWWKKSSRREHEEYMARTFNQPPWETRRNQDKLAREEAERAAKKGKKR